MVQAHQVGERCVGEQFLPGEHFEEDRAQAVEVGALVHELAHALFGAHITGGGEEPALDGQVGDHAEVLGEAEIHQHRAAVGTEQDVGGLEVAVDDAALVDRGERTGDLRGEAQGHARLEACGCAARVPGGQVFKGGTGAPREALVGDARHMVDLEARQQFVFAHEAPEEHRSCRICGRAPSARRAGRRSRWQGRPGPGRLADFANVVTGDLTGRHRTYFAIRVLRFRPHFPGNQCCCLAGRA